MGEERERCLLAGAVSLACPVDLLSMSNHLLTSWIGRALDPVLVESVQRVRAEHEAVLAHHPSLSLAQVKAARTMSAFDDAATAGMMGCRCGSDYYRQASCGPQLRNIKIPYLFMSAAQDPISPAHLVRKDDFRTACLDPAATCPPVVLAVTPEGGHSMVWPEGLTGSGCWAVRVVAEFAAAVTAPPWPSPG